MTRGGLASCLIEGSSSFGGIPITLQVALPLCHYDLLLHAREGFGEMFELQEVEGRY